VDPQPKGIVVTPSNIAVSHLHGVNDVGLRMVLDQERTGLLGLDVIIQLSPTEARQLAAAILRRADEADAARNPS
jgi:hypothetical protein